MVKVCSICSAEIPSDGEIIKVDGKIVCPMCLEAMLLTPDEDKDTPVCTDAPDIKDYTLDEGEEDGFSDGFDEEGDDGDDMTDLGEDSDDTDASEDVVPSVPVDDPVEVTEVLEETVGEPVDAIPSEPVQTDEPPKDEPIAEEIVDKAGKKVKERIADPDTFGQRFNRWVKLRFKGYVILKTLSRDPRTGDFILSTDIIKKKDLPKEAVQCTGESGTYCLDAIKTSKWYAESRFSGYQPNIYEAQFKASDACLYMESNVFDNALSVHWTDWSHVDIKKVMLIVFVAACAVAFIILRLL